METPTAAVDGSCAGVAASNMEARHTVSRNQHIMPTPFKQMNKHSRNTTGVMALRDVMGNVKESGLRTVGVKLRKSNVFATQFYPQITESEVRNHLHRELTSVGYYIYS